MRKAISMILRPHVSALKFAEKIRPFGFALFPPVFFIYVIGLATIGFVLTKLPGNIISDVAISGLKIFAQIYFVVFLAEFAAVLAFNVSADKTPLSKLYNKLSGGNDDA